MKTTDLWLLCAIVLLFLMVLNGLFIAAETAVELLRSMHVKHVREEEGGRSGHLQDLIDRRQKFQTACLLASRIIRLAIFLVVLATAPLIASAADKVELPNLSFIEVLPWVAVICVPVIVVNLVAAELVPRSYASLHPHLVALRLYGMIRLATFILSVPASILVGLANVFAIRFGGKAAFGSGTMAEEEIKNLAESAEETGEIESEERDLIHSVLEFNDTIAREIMTPRVDLDAMPVKSEPAQVVQVIKDTGHSRIPLYEDTDDQIVGIVHAKDLMIAMSEGRLARLRSIMRPALFVPEGKSIHDLLKEMRHTKNQMAIVQDEFGGTAGIVTTEDIVEQLVGEIVDEYDEEEASLIDAGGYWIVSGKTHLDDVNDAIGSEFEDEEFDTIAGFVFGHFGRQPRQGDAIDVEGYQFTVEETDGRRILRLRIEPIIQSMDAPDESAPQRTNPLF